MRLPKHIEIPEHTGYVVIECIGVVLLNNCAALLQLFAHELADKLLKGSAGRCVFRLNLRPHGSGQ